ncbi:MAG: 30S ribosomal protein S6 [Candidatus Magasanikbacteria bacterium GW2011_GWC2_34_16]|uniref:Small ribosomal subunit protein bS6 n=2 Tax=Candidatus Magasanikiibacteriota TaxID=1752731 RepID=A0A0G0JWC0_9BACT|nr:MAG: 30S ribosomal protein S6 [Candidatus Magasanikbacteria bacterium GW2011_GWC2_34_16]KKQ41144.1 MAG: 30S ribosomal protein S6 [Candidatus Magasanikbacteria bacterium GW2011_GWA2_37_8]
MKKYELLLVLPGTLDEKEAEVRSAEVLALLKESDAEATIHNLGKMRLAYPIKQIRYGYFYTIIFSVSPEMLKSIQSKLGLMRDLLRAMITEFNSQFTGPQKISYSTDETGVTTMNDSMVEEVVEEEKEEIKPKAATKVSMQDINKKLDEILDGDIIPGV